MNLTLAFLGPFQVTLNGQPARFATARARALLAYLAVEADRAHRREVLADLLWPDHTETLARQNLSQDLTRLRRAIQDTTGADAHLHVTSTTVQFNAASADVDVTRFQSLLAACASHRHDAIGSCLPCLSRLRAAIALYQGDFLAGFTLKNNQPFNEWSLYQRERLHRQALDSLEVLVGRALAADDYAQAQRYAQRQLDLEPWYEEGHRHRMRALAAQGQRSAALAQYETCRRILAAELRVEPSAETRALYEYIRDAEGEARPPHRPAQGLPSPLTPFIGRTRELAAIHARLREPGVRLLTLVGLGGMGKTRLAIEAARRHADACPDGVYFVPLTPYVGPAALAPAIAATLGLALQGADVWAEALRALQPRQALLVLDGLEHLLASPSERSGEGIESSVSRAVVELLEAAPGVQVVATSRVRLGIPGEHVYVVEGLDYPAQARLEDAASAPAVRLLVESARRRSPSFTLTASNVAAALRLCDLVQGMPLGIELAAAWLELLTPAEVAAEIEKSLDFLAEERSNGLDGQRSLRATFEWSWRRLSESDRQALRRLAVFRGGFTREAAQTVADVSLRDLTGLVYKALLRWNWARGAGGYEMHDVVRQFAAEQLHQDTAERDAVAARHAAFYLDLLEGFEIRVEGVDAPAVIRELQAEAVHIGQAWAWAVAQGDLDQLNRTVYSLWQFYFITGRWAEAERAFRQAVERLRDPGKGEASLSVPPRALLSKLLAMHAYTLHIGKQYNRALAVAAEAIAVAEASDAVEGRSSAEMLYGLVLLQTGSPLAARPHLEQALALSQHHQDQPGEMLWDVEWASEQALALVCLIMGDPVEANSHIQRALQVCRSRGKRRGEAGCLYMLGERAFHARDYGGAHRYYEQALHLVGQIGDRQFVGLGQLSLAETLRMQGDYGQARDLLERALTTLGEAGSVYELKALACLSRLDLYLGDTRSAAQRLADLADVMGPAPTPQVQTFALLTQALLALQGGEPEQAVAHADAARRRQPGPSNPYDQAATLIVVGHAAAAARRAEAREAYQQAVRLCEMLTAPTLAAEARAGLAALDLADGDPAAALCHIEPVLPLLDGRAGIGLDEPFFTYHTACHLLACVGDPRALVALTTARALLARYACSIPDKRTRRMFLRDVPLHNAVRCLRPLPTGRGEPTSLHA